MAEQNDPALTTAGFAALMAPYASYARMAIGVSGGADSMALLALLTRWAEPKNCEIVALSVDHGLRAEAADEAATVAAWCAEHNVPHTTLIWHHDGDGPDANIQAKARQARYGLMGAWCAAHGVPALAVAHHADDRAETLLMRLKRGSGVDGLATMAAEAAWPVSLAGAPRLLRPVLSVSQQALAGFARAAGLPIVHDPSNLDEKFDRVQARMAIEQLGIDIGRLNRTADLMQQEKQVLDWAAQQALGQAAKVSPHGFVEIDIVDFKALPIGVGLRLLRYVMNLMIAPDYPSRRLAVERLHQAVVAGESCVLAGLKFCGGSGKLYVVPERLPDDLPISSRLTDWDSRFAFSCSQRGWRVSARGNLAASALGEAAAARLVTLPASVRASVPVATAPDGTLHLPTFGDAAGQLQLHNHVFQRQRH
ncbi:MAG: tRNA lysidine(34) synthetase TilS [Alphaproteobacteria bacterium]